MALEGFMPNNYIHRDGSFVEAVEPEGNVFEHKPYSSPYELFQQQHPNIDEYGRNVLSGRRFQQTISDYNTLAQRAKAGDQQAGEELIGMFGIGGITKTIKPRNGLIKSSGAQPDDMYPASYDGEPLFNMKNVMDEVKGLPKEAQDRFGKIINEKVYIINETKRLNNAKILYPKNAKIIDKKLTSLINKFDELDKELMTIKAAKNKLIE